MLYRLFCKWFEAVQIGRHPVFCKHNRDSDLDDGSQSDTDELGDSDDSSGVYDSNSDTDDEYGVI